MLSVTIIFTFLIIIIIIIGTRIRSIEWCHFNDLGWPLTQISGARHYLTFNIFNTAIPFFMLLVKTNRPSTLTGRNVRLYNLLIISCFTCSRLFSSSVNSAKRSFYRYANAIFGKVGRITSGETVLQLTKSRLICIPVLLYCTSEDTPTRAAWRQIRRFMKLVQTCDINVVKVYLFTVKYKALL